MTRIDFYILGDGATRTRDMTACRLAEKAFREGLRVYLHTASAEQARGLDELLWSFRDRSFVPHGVGPGADGDTPVRIGSDAEPDGTHEVLINLAEDVPAFFSRFDRVLEIVDTDEGARQAGRARYKFYRDRGYSLETHEL